MVNNAPCTVSFLVCTYNRALHAIACIEHLLSMDTSHTFEVIVRDNASEDDTEARVRALQDSRVSYVRAPVNQGTITFLEAAKAARGEFLTWLSDEDNFEEKRLDEVISAFRGNPDCEVLLGGLTVGRQASEVLRPSRVYRDLVSALKVTLNFSGCGGVFVRREAFTNACDLVLGNQLEAYQAWNYYPIGNMASRCVQSGMITTESILVRQVRHGATTNNWSRTEAGSAPGAELLPHYYPESMIDRLFSTLTFVLENPALGFVGKGHLALWKIRVFAGNVGAVLHPGLINLLSENYSADQVDRYRNHVRKLGLERPGRRALWVACAVLGVALGLFRYKFFGAARRPASLA